jgi:hypothetical protein
VLCVPTCHDEQVTNEPPAGLQAGVLRSLSTVVDQEMLERVDSPEWRRLVFAVVFLHTVVQERRKFGSLGWNLPYEFNVGDLQVRFVDAAPFSRCITLPLLTIARRHGAMWKSRAVVASLLL